MSTDSQKSPNSAAEYLNEYKLMFFTVSPQTYRLLKFNLTRFHIFNQNDWCRF